MKYHSHHPPPPLPHLQPSSLSLPTNLEPFPPNITCSPNPTRCSSCACTGKQLLSSRFCEDALVDNVISVPIHCDKGDCVPTPSPCPSVVCSCDSGVCHVCHTENIYEMKTTEDCETVFWDNCNINLHYQNNIPKSLSNSRPNTLCQNYTGPQCNGRLGYLDLATS